MTRMLAPPKHKLALLLLVCSNRIARPPQRIREPSWPVNWARPSTQHRQRCLQPLLRTQPL